MKCHPTCTCAACIVNEGRVSPFPNRTVRIHPALGAPYVQPAGQRINLGRIGIGQSARVSYEPTHDEGSTP